MKKSIKIMGIAAMVLLLAVSCKKENKNGFNGETKFMTFSAGISQGNGKTYLNGLNLLWSDGDQIRINNNAPFTLTNGAGSSKGEFEGEAEEAETYYAVYPASSTLNDGTATITLPAVQPYVAGSFAKGIAPMVAKTDDSKAFTFTNVCGLLRLNVNIDGTDPVKRIVLQSVANENLAGTGTVEIVGDGTEKLAIDPAKGSGKEVAVTSEAGITGESQIVFVLPAGTLTDGFNVYFYDDTEGTGQLTSRSTTSSDFVIQAGTMNEVTIGNKVKRDPIALAISPEPKPTSEKTYPTLPDNYGMARLDYTSKNNFDSDYQSINLPAAGSKDKTIEVELTSLTPCTKYIVRLVVDSEITLTLSFTTACDDPVPDGALSGLFSVSVDKQVYFSKGNLVATVDASGNPTAWKFADHQYDRLGTGGANQKIGTAAGDVDLFCWSTNATGNNWGILPRLAIDDAKLLGDFVDWGKAIDNKGTWRTLSGQDYLQSLPTDAYEWEYLLATRSGDKAPEINGKTDCRYAAVKVNGKTGLLVFPDIFTWPTEVTTFPSKFNVPSSNWNNVNYTVEQFTSLEDAGAVFLPAAGFRGDSVINTGDVAYYWSSTVYTATQARCLTFHAYSVVDGSLTNRNDGCSVRLVTDAN